jgi:hypothetical protein
MPLPRKTDTRGKCLSVDDVCIPTSRGDEARDSLEMRKGKEMDKYQVDKIEDRLRLLTPAAKGYLDKADLT